MILVEKLCRALFIQVDQPVLQSSLITRLPLTPRELELNEEAMKPKASSTILASKCFLHSSDRAPKKIIFSDAERICEAVTAEPTTGIAGYLNDEVVNFTLALLDEIHFMEFYK